MNKKKDKKNKDKKKLEKAQVQVVSQPGEAIRSSFMEVAVKHDGAEGETVVAEPRPFLLRDRKSTRLNSSHT